MIMSLKQREIKVKPRITLNRHTQHYTNCKLLRSWKYLIIRDCSSVGCPQSISTPLNPTPVVEQFKRRTGYIRTSSRLRNWFDLELKNNVRGAKLWFSTGEEKSQYAPIIGRL